MEFISPSELHVKVDAPLSKSAKEILTVDALRFVGFLNEKFDDTRRSLLTTRRVRATEYDAGEVPTFITNGHRDAVDDPAWKCAPVPDDLRDRRVEITGPVDRKMVINGLNSGANVYMADFEDSTSPTWNNIIEGQVNLRDAVNGTITYTNPSNGKLYVPNDTTSVLFVRPRGWHLDEAHVTVNGRPMSASLFDFGMYYFHNVHGLTTSGTAPYFYLPKLESHHEARLWNDVFVAAQNYLAIPIGTIRATALLETITAAFEMEEILFELREHSVGLNCGRWDYLFSFIKKFKRHDDRITPDREFLTMKAPLMEAYVKRLIYVCHKRGTFAMGGMSAAIPVKNDPAKNAEAMAKVEQDKLREVRAGHDGTWVAHPALVDVAKKVFDEHMKTPNQIDAKNDGGEGSNVTELDLLRLPSIPDGRAITSDGLKRGIAIVMAYTEAWLRGIGCIPLNHAMEDAATAEISRAQIWQWRANGVATQDDGQLISSERISKLVREEVKHHQMGGNGSSQGGAGKWKVAGSLVERMLNASELDDFLTSVCYPYIVTPSNQSTIAKL